MYVTEMINCNLHSLLPMSSGGGDMNKHKRLKDGSENRFETDDSRVVQANTYR